MKDDVVIWGMTYDTYDQNNDPRGDIGHALAEARYQREGLPFGENKRDWEAIARVALKRFPELQRGERVHTREVSRRLGEIRAMGYDVAPYSKMNAERKWAYLTDIRRDITANLLKRCPEVLHEIAEANTEAQRNAMELS